MQDELFRPTIRDEAAPGRPPWRPESIVYPAFFGGPLAAATLGVLNGRRLRLPRGRLLLIAAAGVAAFAARLTLALTVLDSGAPVRLAGAVAGMAVWLLVMSFQRGAFRAFDLRGTAPASLVGPGLLAVFTLGLLENGLILALTR